MDNKQNLTEVPNPTSSLDTLDATVNGTQVEPTNTLLPQEYNNQYKTVKSNTKTLKLARVITLGVLSFFVLILAVAYGVGHFIDSKKAQSAASVASAPASYTVMTLPLNNLVESGQLQVDQNNQLTLNGQLRLNNATVLTPISTPTNPVAGEFYYSETTKQPYFYNGTSFISMSSPGQTVNSIAGLNGAIQLGAGLEVSDGKIAVIPSSISPTSVVTSLQGQTGTVLLASGSGIGISGTTITNNGVTSLGGATGNLTVGSGLQVTGNTIASNVNITSSSSNLVVTPDGNGDFAISLSGSGTSGTVALGPASAQDDSSINTSSIFINKTGSGDLIDLQFNGTDQFVVNSSGVITSGSIPYSDITGAPSATVISIGGESGALTLGQGLTISGSVLANSGVSFVGGTANQVIVSNDNGNVTLSLPQDLSVNSSPTFTNISLTNPLSVANGGTGASTVTGARLNLSAAESGANADITSLLGLTSISPSSTLTVGTTGENLILQGSTGTTLSATSGGYTTSLVFSTPSAINTVTIPNSSGTVCLDSGNCLGGSAGGANTGLSNLSSITAINSNLTPGTTGTENLGSGTEEFQNLYLSGTAVASTFLQNGYQVCDTSGNCLGGGSGGANTDLSNLSATTAINSDLTPGITGTVNIGSASEQFQDLYLSGTAVAGYFSGNGSLLTNLNGANITGSTVPNSALVNPSITVTNGTNVTGGTTVSLGGSVTIGVVNSPVFSGTVTVQGANGLTLGTANASTGGIIFQGSGGSGSLTVQGPDIPDSGNYTLSIPAITGNDTVCTVNLGNCTSSISGNYVQLQGSTPGAPQTGDLNISGTAIAGYFSGNGSLLTNLNGANITGSTVPNSALVNPSITVTNGTNVTGGTTVSLGGSVTIGVVNSPVFSGTVTVQGANGLTLGTANASTGGIIFQGSGGSGSLTVQGPDIPDSGNYTLSIPAITGNDTVCTVNLGNCTSSISGNYVQLQGSTPGAPQTGDLNISGTAIAGYFSGNGSLLTNLNGANITGSTVPNSALVNPSITVTNGTNVTGGTTVSLGGSVTIGVVNSPVFSGTVTVQGANGLTLGTANASTGGIIFQGSGGSGSLTVQGPDIPDSGNYTLSIPAITGNDTVCTVNLGNCLGPTGTGANIALSNLSATTAINSDLTPGITGTVNIGSASEQFQDLYLSGTAVAGYFSGNGSLLTNLNGANITGSTVPNSALVNPSITVTNGTNVTGGTTVSLGGSVTIGVVNSPVFSGTVTVQGANALNLGTASTSSGSVTFNNSGGTGTINLQPTASANTGNYTLSIPILTGNDTICTNNVLCSNYAPATGSGSYVQLQGSTPGAPQTGDLNISGTAIAGYFSGNGSLLTNLNGANITGSTVPNSALVNPSITVTNGTNVTGGTTVSLGGSVTIGVVNSPVFSGTVTVQGANALNLGTASTSSGSVTFNNSGGTGTINLQPTASANTGNYTLSIPILTGNDTICTNNVLCSNYAPATGSGSYVQLQGSTPGAPQTGDLNISGTAIAGYFSGNGSLLTNLNGANITGSTVPNSALVNPSITVTNGTNVTGGTTVSLGGSVTIGVVNSPVFSGTVTVQGANALNLGTASTSSGSVTFNNSGGTGTINLQPTASANTGNYTLSIPILTGNDTICTNNVLCSNYAPATGSGSYVQLQGSTPGAPQTGDLNISGTAIAGYFSGNGSLLTNLNGANITGSTVPNSALVNPSITVTNGTNVTGGTTVSLGGSVTIGVVNSPVFSGTVTVQGANALNLGTASTSSGSVTFNNSGGTGTINLQPTASANTGNYTLSIPILTGNDTICTNNVLCSNYAPATGSGSYVQLQGSTPGAPQTGDLNISGTAIAGYFSGNGSLLTNLNGANITGSTVPNSALVNPSITVTNGTNVTGGTTVSLGGSVTIGVVNSPVFSGTVTVQGANGLTLGTANASTGGIIFQGSGGSGSLTVQGPDIPDSGNYTLSIPAITGNDTVCTVNLGNCLGGGSGGANTSLSNLDSTTAINSNLTPGTTGTENLGSGTEEFQNLYLSGTAVASTFLQNGYQVCDTSGNCLGGGSGGANTDLSNLSATTAINSDLTPGITGTVNIGSASEQFQDLYLSGTAVAGYFSGNGSLLTNLNGANITGSTVPNSALVNPSITVTNGTNVTGGTTVSLGGSVTIGVVNSPVFSGTVTVQGANALNLGTASTSSGSVTFNNSGGTGTINLQPTASANTGNYTLSIPILTGNDTICTNNVLCSNYAPATGSGSYVQLQGSTPGAPQTGDLNISGTAIAGYFSGNGSLLTNLNGANITGSTVPNSALVNPSITVTNGTNVTGGTTVSLGGSVTIGVVNSPVFSGTVTVQGANALNLGTASTSSGSVTFNNSGGTGTINLQPTASANTGNYTLSIPILTGNDTICTNNVLCSNYAPATGSGSYVQLQGSTPGAPQTGDLNISGTAIAGYFSGNGSLLTNLNGANITGSTVPNSALVNPSITVTNGTNVTGGTTVSLGGSVTIGVVNSPVFSGTVTVQGANALNLGTASTSSGSVTFNNSGGTGTINLQPTASANTGNYTLSIPILTGNDTICTNNVLCSNYAPATGSGSYVQLQGSTPGAPQTGDLNISGTAIAGYFSGNGSLLTNLNGANITGSTVPNSALVNPSITVTNGTNVTGGTTVSLGGSVTIGVVNSPVFSGTVTVQGANALNLGTASTSSGSVTFNNSGGTGTINLQPTASANTGNYTLSIPILTGNDTICTNNVLCSNYAPATGSGSYVQLQGSTPGAPQTGDLNISGTAIAGYFSGNGSLLTNLNGANITGSTVPNSALVNPSITVTNGTNVTGGTTVSLGGSVTIGVVNSPVFSGTVTVQGANALNLGTASTSSGSVTFNNSGGTGTINLQPTASANTGNYTLSIPILTGNDTICTNNVLCSNYAPATGSGSYVQLQGSTPGAPQTGDLNISGTAIAGYFSGNGSLLTNLNGANITGSTVPNSALVNPSITVTNGTNVTGGTTVSLGGSVTIGVVNSPVFSGTVTVQGANALNLGTASTSSGSVTFNNSGGTGTINLQPTASANTGNYTLSIPILTGNDTICTNNVLCSNYAPATGSTSYIQNTTSLQSGANFNIGGSGQIGLSLSVGTTITASGNINTTSGKYLVNGTQIASSNLLDSSNLAKLNATQSFTGANTFADTSLTALQVANASSADVLTVDTTDSQTIFGNNSSAVGQVVFDDGTNTNAVTINAGTGTANYTITLPTVAPTTTQCLKAGSTTASLLVFGSCGVTPSGIQNQTALQTNANFDIQGISSTVGGVIEANGADILDLENSSGVTVDSFSSAGSFAVNNSASTSLFSANTSTTKVTVGQGDLVVTGLGVPTGLALAIGSNQGGTFSGAPGTTYYYTVSAINNVGETLASTESSISSSSFTPITAPSTAPTAAITTGSNLGVGAYKYEVTFVTANGETTGSPEASITTTTGNQAVNLSNIPLGATGTVSRNIYRTAVGGASGSEKLVGTIANNTVTTYSDTLADASLGAALPGVDNATTNTNNITVTFNLNSGATSYRVYRGTSSGGENFYQTTTGSPFTDTGTGTAGTSQGSDQTARLGVGTSTPSANLQVIGTTLLQTPTNTASAFQIQNASGTTILGVSTTPVTATSGSLGTWSTNIAVLPKSLSGNATFTYNNYAYSLGGCTIPTSTGYGCTSYTDLSSTVYYTPLNSNGTTNIWNTTTALSAGCSAGEADGAVLVNNSYVYYVGGLYSTGCGALNISNVVSYAAINSNGALGTWSTTTNLPATIQSSNVSVYNGYMYIVGGATGTTASTGVNTVYYAPINSNGSVGTWNTSTYTLPTALSGASTVTDNGYLYIFGGTSTSGTALNSVYYTQLQPNGSIGPWTTAGNLTQNEYGAQAVLSNNSVFLIGGYNGTTYLNNVYTAALNTNGTVGSWSNTGSNLPATLDYGAATTASNGYVYYVGGYNGTASTNTVYYSLLPGTVTIAPGTLTVNAVWTVTSPVNLAQTTIDAGSTFTAQGNSVFQDNSNSTTAFQIDNANGSNLFNVDTTNTKVTVGQGDLVVTGLGVPTGLALAIGSNQGGTFSGAPGTTYYYTVSAINNVGETLASTESSISSSSFTPITAPSTAPTAAITTGSNLGVGAYKYEVTFVTANGETTGSPEASITTTTGNQAVNLSNIPLGATGTVSRNIYRTAVGGASGSEKLVGTIANNTVTTYSDTLADASLGAALPGVDNATTNTNNITVTFNLNSGATSYRVYRGTSSGGENFYQTTTGSPFTDTGTGTAGTSQGSDQTARLGVGTSTPSANLQVDGTFQVQNASGTTILGVSTTPVTATSGSLGTWSTNSTYPLISSQNGDTTFTYSGYIFEINGCPTGSGYNCNSGSNTAYSAPINSNGSTGSWTAITGPGIRNYGQVVVNNGYVYYMGGYNSSDTYENSIYYAAINSNGTLGTWNTNTTSLPAALSLSTADAYNGYMYVVGGSTGAAYTSGVNTVYYAPINSNGSVGTWNTSTYTLPTALSGASTVTDNGYLYIFGGTSTSGTALNSVYYTQLQPNGSIGPWTTAGNLTQNEYGAQAVLSNNSVFLIGGYNGTTYLNNVYTAALNTNGTVGSWSNTGSNLPATLDYGAATTASNGYVYYVGGYNGTASTNTVYYSLLPGTVTIAPGTLTVNAVWTVTSPVNLAQTTIDAGSTFTAQGNSVFQDNSNSTTAFQIDNANGSNLFNVDTTNTKVTVGQGDLVVTGLGVPTGLALAIGSNQGGTFSGAPGTTYYYTVSAINNVGETLASTESSISSSSFTPITAPSTAPTAAITTGSNLGVGAYKYEVTFVTANGETTGSPEASITTTTGNQAVNLSNIPLGATGTVSRNIYRTAVGGASGSEKLVGTIANNTVTTYSDTLADASLGAALPGVDNATTNTNNITVTFNLNSGATSYRVYRGTSSGGENFYQTTTGSPFTDTGTGGTAGSPQTSDQTAEVGIGTSTPSANLQVDGTFQVQNASGTTILGVSTTPVTATSGSLGTWSTNSTYPLPASLNGDTTFTYSGYIFEINGCPTGSGYSCGSGNTVVYSAPINSNGSTASWSTTSSIGAARNYGQVVVNNGYVYYMGGYNGSDTYESNIYYNTINTNGTLGGSWSNNATSLPAALSLSTADAYNGYMYIVGGATGTTASTGVHTVYYAPINSNGSVGTWNTSTYTLPTALSGASTVTDNGYLYIFGGTSTSGTALNSVYYTQLQPNGSIGPWTTAGNLTQNEYGAQAVLSNNSVFLIGGYNGTTYLNNVYTAALNTNGTVGSWSNTGSNLPATLDYGAATTASNGYVYYVGGYNGTASTNTVYYSLLPGTVTIAPGTLTVNAVWTVTSPVNLAQTTIDAGSTFTAQGNSVFQDNSNSTTAFQIDNANGSNLFNVDTTNTKVTVGQGDLVVTGLGVPTGLALAIGSNQGGTFSGAPGTTYYYTVSAINNVGETLASTESSISSSSFTPITAPSTAPTAAITTGSNLGVGAYKYEVTFVTANGETTGSPEASITTTTGNQAVNLSNIPLGATGTVSRNIYRTAVGGASGSEKLVGTIANNTVTTYSDTLADASLGAALPGVDNATTNTNNITVTFNLNSGATSYRVYRGTSSGGENFYQTTTGSPFTDTGTGGTAGSPQTSDQTAEVGIGTSTPSANLQVDGTFQVQNASGTTILGVSTTPVTATSGSLGTWSTNSTYPLPASLNGDTTFTYSGYIFEINGCPTGSGYSCGSGNTVVYSAPINSNGSTASWSTTSSIGAARNYGQVVVNNGYVYYMGGYNGSDTYESNIYYNTINTNGTLGGSWSNNATSLPAALSLSTADAYNGYMYIVGGATGTTASTGVNTVYYAPINSNGSVGTWNTSTYTLPTALSGASTVTDNGYLYIFGGTSTSGTALNSVYYTQLQPNGSIGPWTTSGSTLPQLISGSEAVVSNNSVFLIGGYNGSGYLNTTYTAALNTNGTVGSWSNTGSNLPATLDYGAATTASNGYVYYVGGYNGTASTNTVYYSLLPGTVTIAPGTLTVNAVWTVTSPVNLAQTTIDAGSTFTAQGNSVFQDNSNSTTAFQIDNANGSNLFNVDTTNTKVTVGQGDLVVTGLGVPTGLALAIGSNQGGTFSGAPGTTYYYTVSAINNVGETLASTESSISSSSFTPITAPSTAPTAAITTGSNLGVGAYKYEVTFVTANGETTGSPEASITTTTGNQAVNLSNIPLGATGTVSRNIYRTAVGGASGSEKLVGTIANNTVTTYSDTLADASLGAALPGVDNATTNTNNITVTFNLNSGATSYRVYRGTSSGGENFYQTTTGSPFTDTGTGTAGTSQGSDQTARLGVGTSTPSANLQVIGTTLLQTPTNTASAFQIQNASGTTILGVSTTPVTATSGSLGTWSTNSSYPLSASVSGNNIFTYNGYIYNLNGCTVGLPATSCTGTPVNTYYAPLNSNGTTDAWNTTTSPNTSHGSSYSLEGGEAVVNNGYVYYVGGWDYGYNTQSAVQYSAINTNGTLGAWTTTTALPATLMFSSVSVYNGYMYVVGGSTGAAYTSGVNTVYYAPINSNGSVGTWNTSTYTLPTALSGASTVTDNGYLYIFGGTSTSGTALNSVYYTQLQPNGSIGPWTTAGNLTQNEYGAQAVLSNNSVFLIGGYNGTTYLNNVYTAALNTNGTVGSWSNTGSNLPATLDYGAATTASNGYVYYVGGYNGTASTNTVYYSLLPGTSVVAPGSLSISGQINSTGPAGFTGKVCIGVGACSGSEALGVIGNIIASGTISQSGSPDYAEDITTSDPTVTAGDLVSLDPANPGEVTKSSAAYDPNLIGAISTDPGFLTNAPDDAVDGATDSTQVPLALSGRIPVNVDTENGPVDIGDYITSSSTPGVGMVATAPGEVIGVAMTSYDGSGTGSVTVYLEHFFYNPTTPSGSATFTSLSVSGQATLDALTVSSDENVLGDLTVSGSTTVASITINGHIITGGATPTITAATNAGSDASDTISGDDSAGTITLTTGTNGISGGSEINVTFSSPYTNVPHILLTPNDSGSAPLEVYPSNVTDNGFTLNVTNTPLANTSYSFEYFSVQ